MKSFELGKYSIGIDAKDGKIIEIKNGNNFVDFSALTWKVQLADKRELTADCGMEFSYTCSDELTFSWHGCGVKVSLKLFTVADELKSSISVSSENIGISRVYYPIYKDVKRLPGDVLMLPWQNGLTIKNPLTNLLAPDKHIRFWMGRGEGKYENDYPAQYSYQLFLYYSECGEGYYMSCDDRDAYIKTIGMYKSENEDCIDFGFINYPEDMGITGSYSTPYNYVFRFISGGWREGARIYRDWARAQKWYAPLDKRDISKSVFDIDFVRINHEHYILGTDDKEYYETAKMQSERLGAKTLMHWYGWNKAPKHGDWYPEMADWSSAEWYNGLLKRNRELDGIGVKKIPYVNVHLWDKNLKSFGDERAEQYLIMPESMKITDEPWRPDGSLYPACHATARVKGKARWLFSHLVENDGFDGIYIDQVASFNATLCFNKEHGHPIGGGRWWTDEYHNMIGEFRKEMPKDKILTTESCCECYHDLFDMFLILDTCSQGGGFSGVCGPENVESIPLFKMIYGDSAIAYGSSCKLEGGDGEFEFNYIRNILFGMIPTVEGAPLECKDESFKWDIMKRGVDFFKENREVLLCGILDDYITFGDNERVLKFGRLEKSCPGVVCAIYSYKGEKKIFAYNYSDSDKSVSVSNKTLKIKAKSFSAL